MDMEPKLSLWIQQKIVEFSGTSSNEPEYLKKLARYFQVLPILSGWSGFWGIRSDGVILLISIEEDVEFIVETDSRIRTTALYQGTKKYPELKPLVPQRPAIAQDCSYCGGTGQAVMENFSPDALVCYCGGIGWLE
jgi:hypothetical protein